MANITSWGAHYTPSTHYGRQNVNNRYQQRAMQAAQQSLFMQQYYQMNYQPIQQQTTVKYETGPSNGYLAGAITGQALNTISNNWDTISTIGKAIGNGISNLWNKWFG